MNGPAFTLKRIGIPFAGVILLLFTAHCTWLKGLTGGRGCQEGQLWPQKKQEMAAVGLAELWRTGDLSQTFEACPLTSQGLPLYVAARSQGAMVGSVWASGKGLEGLSRAFRYLREKAGSRVSEITHLELSFSYAPGDWRSGVNPQNWEKNRNRGIWGWEFQYKKSIRRFAPTYALVTNRSYQKIAQLVQSKWGLTDQQFMNKVRVRRFKAHSYILTLGAQPKITALERGNQWIPLKAVSAASTQKLADLMVEWLQNNVHDDGQMTYKYWPSRGQESKRNNMIRQWMATVALIRAGKFQTDVKQKQKLFELAQKNINYNLKHFYKQQADGRAWIEYDGKVKLGGLALAALALIEHPQRLRWSQQEQRLLHTIQTAWNKNGSYRTWLQPKDKTGGENFYPGEALYTWAHYLNRSDYSDLSLIKKFMTSFQYYKSWHLDESKPYRRNPAFVPWHTQAYFLLWKHNKDPQLSDFIFTMNDWLVLTQEWNSKKIYRDTRGRFYDSDQPFGPPHASSTGVYLEGLIDAYQVAVELNDQSRARAYRKTILRGLRSLMQLQFQDDLDMFYVSAKNRAYVRGGLRTTVYNNEVRCDNIQHGLMAVLKILQIFGHHTEAWR